MAGESRFVEDPLSPTWCRAVEPAASGPEACECSWYGWEPEMGLYRGGHHPNCPKLASLFGLPADPLSDG